MKMIIDKTADFCSRYEMLPKGGKVLCAVSGGKDSMALLHILTTLKPEFGFDLADERLGGQGFEKGFDQKPCGFGRFETSSRAFDIG